MRVLLLTVATLIVLSYIIKKLKDLGNKIKYKEASEKWDGIVEELRKRK